LYRIMTLNRLMSACFAFSVMSAKKWRKNMALISNPQNSYGKKRSNIEKITLFREIWIRKSIRERKRERERKRNPGMDGSCERSTCHLTHVQLSCIIYLPLSLSLSLSLCAHTHSIRTDPWYNLTSASRTKGEHRYEM
jgi:hypothetical protein